MDDQAGDFIAQQLREVRAARRRTQFSFYSSAANLVLLLATLAGIAALWLRGPRVVVLHESGSTPTEVLTIHQWHSNPFASGKSDICVTGVPPQPVSCKQWTADLSGEHQSAAELKALLQHSALIVLVGGYDISSFRRTSRTGIQTNPELAEARAGTVQSQIEDALKTSGGPTPRIIRLAGAPTDVGAPAESDRRVSITTLTDAGTQ